VAEPGDTGGRERRDFSRQVSAQVARKLQARNDPTRVVPFGLGMMGLIGWSVTVPTLLGAALGIWLDRHYPGGHSWTLALLIAGLAAGCWTAWRWVAREMTALQRSDHDEPK
jgi:ATP synthase protein I